mmetsp:Transcript_12930/g.28311  ORF Transcript_12930/g.28311 Transcript_12930/m.28311 type:complete len:202 (-) Transcript_12930:407-1012(-)
MDVRIILVLTIVVVVVIVVANVDVAVVAFAILVQPLHRLFADGGYLPQGNRGLFVGLCHVREGPRRLAGCCRGEQRRHGRGIPAAAAAAAAMLLLLLPQAAHVPRGVQRAATQLYGGATHGASAQGGGVGHRFFIALYSWSGNNHNRQLRQILSSSRPCQEVQATCSLTETLGNVHLADFHDLGCDPATRTFLEDKHAGSH